MRVNLFLMALALSTAPAAAAELRFNIPCGAAVPAKTIRAVNQSVTGVHVDPAGHALAVHVDTLKLPRTMRAIEKSVRLFTAISNPAATAVQSKRCGLFLPESPDPAKPIVLLIHGVDMERSDLADLAKPLTDAGMQIGYFQYLPDQPIADDIAALTTALKELHRKTPALHLDLVGYSMGGLVARGYVEGDGYAGGVDRLMMLATPNHGSAWAPLLWVLNVEQQADQAKKDKDWRPSWIVTGGLCEAASDLKEGSKFLTALNARPRRAGVKYTIVAGDRSPARRVVATAVAAPQVLIPKQVRSTLWYSVTRLTVTAVAVHAVDPDGDSDGPVKLTSARLEAVDDFVTVHADHQTMIRAVDGKAPAAAAVILERIKP